MQDIITKIVVSHSDLACDHHLDSILCQHAPEVAVQCWKIIRHTVVVQKIYALGETFQNYKSFEKI